MAEAFAKHHSAGGVEAKSAGTAPANSVNPVVVQAMQEKGIDISNSVPKLLRREMVELADCVITMGCAIDEVCPLPPESHDWGLDDPAGRSLDEVRRIRDQIESNVLKLLAEPSR